MVAFVVAALGAMACEPGIQPGTTPQIAMKGGTLVMGSNDNCSDAQGTLCAGDRVTHPVALSAFLLDRTEVTIAEYADCVVNGPCDRNGAEAFDPDRQNQPVLVEDPNLARTFCSWKGLRLPTEAEFEYASRLGADGQLHTYPWGDDAPACDGVPSYGCPDTQPHDVGTRAKDVSALGIHDLAGSVPEWVDDQYVATVGCADRLSYGDLCWGQAASCVDARCTADGDACAKGCLPPRADEELTLGGAMVTSTPLCPTPPSASMPPRDPVIRALGSFAVVRGAGPLDRACDLAGTTRRHATPRAYRAGFRCAKSMDRATTPTPPLTYRLSLGGCPSPTFPVDIAVAAAGGAAVDFGADVFPLDPSLGAMTLQSSSGAVSGVPCSATVVLHPTQATPVTVTISDPTMCVSGVRTVDLTPGGDVPEVGSDAIQLVVGAQCQGG